MKYYRSYMDRQEVSAGAHEKLLDLNVPRKAPRRSRAKYGALAACAVLIAGVGAWKLASGPVPGAEADPTAAADTPAPVQTEAVVQLQPDKTQPMEPPNGFVVNSPDGDKLPFPTVPEIAYPDMTGAPTVSAMRAYTPGAFTVTLTMKDIQDIFWGPEGRPESEYPKLEQGELPWTLFWDGYTVRGVAWYDGQGRFTDLSIWGENGRAGFILGLRLGAMPLTSCVVDTDRDGKTSEFNGVEVTGWSQVYDRDRDGLTDYICGSEFMTDSGVGVRFESDNSSMRSDYGGFDMELGGNCAFNALFVRQALTGGLYLDHLMTADHIPAWRDVKFDTLEQARQEAEFAPYLPAAEPEGYSAYTGCKDFSARLSYQEGNQNTLHIRWSRGYDNVEVTVRLPEGTGTDYYEPVDINVPESYDTRLYEIPWSESVPWEYRVKFSNVTFRAEDMSLETVMAREAPHDTGGVSFHFNVLHPNGVVVGYSCDGMTARQVWELVKETL